MFNLIMAVDQHGRIGRGRNLLWHIPRDLVHFKNMTKGKVVVVGQETLKSIGMLLPGRKHVIIAKTRTDAGLLRMIERRCPGTAVLGFITETEDDIYSIPEMVAHFLEDRGYDCSDAWVIGGAKVYSVFSNYVSRFVITHVTVKPGADFLISDVYAPMFPALLNSDKVQTNVLLDKPISTDDISKDDIALTYKIVEYRVLT